MTGSKKRKQTRLNECRGPHVAATTVCTAVMSGKKKFHASLLVSIPTPEVDFCSGDGDILIGVCRCSLKGKKKKKKLLTRYSGDVTQNTFSASPRVVLK